MGVPGPRDLSFGARLAIWFCAGSWIIGFALATIPDSFRFSGQLVGGVFVTLIAALALDRLALRAPQYLAGAICLLVVLLGSYWSVWVAPAVIREPEVLARLQKFGASAEFPPHVVAAVAVLGVVLLVRGWRRKRSPLAERSRLR
jgi:hypothetical protein